MQAYADFWMEWQTRIVELPWIDIGVAVLIALLVFAFRKLFTKYIFRFILKMTHQSRSQLFTNILVSFERPIRMFFAVFGIYLALLYLPIPWDSMTIINRLYGSILIVLAAWGTYKLLNTSSMLFNPMIKRLEGKEDNMLVPFLSRVLRIIIVALAFTIILSSWGFNINGFVAGLGLGGLAFALAAQDMVANFIGGIIIVVERPFKRGDWIYTPTVEGIVEDISFRSTKVRTFADSIVIVPNNTLAHEAITNWSEMRKREIDMTLGIEYQTPREQVLQLRERLEEMLNSRDDIDKELILVQFKEFNSSSLDLWVYCFTKTTAFLEWAEIKEELNLEIIRILQEEGVQFAYPTQSIYIEKSPEENYHMSDNN
ncbi:mechanosensitive ion channel family protein [Marinococcus halotolerans]|uniref:mechanosensitive ion channel family protein n=1 Tax=Marinococcus halotolerans TaxID=301092 RepID=UPI0003B4113E|nr:mechanosensitive ion channel family protein [Marinococcus halotolerans]